MSALSFRPGTRRKAGSEAQLKANRQEDEALASGHPRRAKRQRLEHSVASSPSSARTDDQAAGDTSPSAASHWRWEGPSCAPNSRVDEERVRLGEVRFYSKVGADLLGDKSPCAVALSHNGAIALLIILLVIHGRTA